MMKFSIKVKKIREPEIERDPVVHDFVLILPQTYNRFHALADNSKGVIMEVNKFNYKVLGLNDELIACEQYLSRSHFQLINK